MVPCRISKRGLELKRLYVGFDKFIFMLAICAMIDGCNIIALFCVVPDSELFIKRKFLTFLYSALGKKGKIIFYFLRFDVKNRVYTSTIAGTRSLV